MKKNVFIFIVVVFLLAMVFVLIYFAYKNRQVIQRNIISKNISQVDDKEVLMDVNKIEEQNKSDIVLPLDRVNERMTKKPFGMYITKQDSPVQPENFTGFHTGIDLEIFPEELEIDVSVKTMCVGKIVEKEYAIGYGGVVVQSCILNNELVTVIYGHLKLESIEYSVGDEAGAGEKLGVLGRAYSTETSGERKHLHLGIHRGELVNILGYVQSKSELSDWIDPCIYLCKK